MKKLILTIVSVLIGGVSQVQAQNDINLTGYTLSFDDEFNTLSATTTSPKGSSAWFALPANGSTGDFSESTWDLNAFSVSNGILSDKAFLDSSNNWHSGELNSVDTTGAGFSQTYGYFEIRCQMPNSGSGAWPAFWLDTTSGLSGQSNEEIDIFEWYGICDTAGSYQAVMQEATHNWNSDGSQNQTAPYLYSPGTPMPGGAYPWQGYHIYGCQVDPVHITWYIDGVQTNRIATPASYINTPFYIILDYALGGGWSLDGMVNNSTLNVDWVRVYSLPTSGAPAITSSTSASGTVGTPFSYQITATNSPTSYNATGLPTGLSINTSTGNISGTPSAAGTSSVTMSAANASGTATAVLTLTVTGSGGGSNLLANDTYEIVSQSSSLALSASGTSNGSSVVQQAYTGESTQQWTLTNLGSNVVDLKSSGTSAALEVPGSSTTNGTDLEVTGYTGGTNQQWMMVQASSGYYEVVNVNSGLEANVAYNSMTAGTAICQYTAGNYANGVWAFTPVGGETTTYALTVNNGTGSGNYAAGAQVTVTADTAPSGEQFAAWTGATGDLANPSAGTTTLIMPASAASITATYSSTGGGGGGGNLVSNGTYEIVANSSGLALAAAGTSNGSAVQQQTYTSAATQQWTLTNLGSNVVEMKVSGTSEALEVPGSSTSGGTLLDVSSYTGGTNQQWTLVAASEAGYYELVNVNSGLEANVGYNSMASGAGICQYLAGDYANGIWSFTSTGSPTTYALTVNNGTGGGNYAAGTQVTVSASAAPSGEQFAGWTGATGDLASASESTTTLTMPNSAVSITASYSSTGGGGNLIANGTYRIVADSSSLSLASSGVAGGSSVVQQTYAAAATQQWTLTDLGTNNVVKLINVGASSALDVPGASTSVVDLDIASYSGGTNQQWTIVPSGTTGYYEIINVNSGLGANVTYNSMDSGAPICQYLAGNSSNSIWTFMAP